MFRSKIIRVIAVALVTSTLATIVSSLGGGAAYAAGEKIYWENDYPRSCSPTSKSIGSANLDGSSIDSITVPNATLSCGYDAVYQIATDANYLYWGQPNSKKIARANLDGSNANLNFISGITYGGYGIAVDANYIYFDNSREYLAKTDHSIGRANLDGSGVINNFINLGTGGADNLQVAEGYLYWSNRYSVKRIKSDGSGSIMTVATFENETFGFSINTNNIFYADDRANKIYKSNLDGSELSLLLSLRDVSSGIAATDSYLYWTQGVLYIGRAKLDDLSVDYSFIPGIRASRAVAVRFSRVSLSSSQDQAAIAATVAAQRIAEAKREAEKQAARAEITNSLKTSKDVNLEMFSKAEISGVTAANIAAVQAEIAALPQTSRADLSHVLIIARKYEVVGKIASDQFASVYSDSLIEIGLIPQGSKHKAAITAAIKKLPLSDRSSYAVIKKAIDAEIAEIQTRKDRLAKVITRNTSRYSK
jgi:hypothetical protein